MGKTPCSLAILPTTRRCSGCSFSLPAVALQYARSRPGEVPVVGQRLFRDVHGDHRAQPQPQPHLREQARQRDLRELDLPLLRLSHLRVDSHAQPEPPQVREHARATRPSPGATPTGTTSWWRPPTSSSRLLPADPTKAFIAQGAEQQPRDVPHDPRPVRRSGASATSRSSPWPSRCTAGGTGFFVLTCAVAVPAVVRAVDHHALQLRAARSHRPLVEARPLAQLREPAPQLPAVQQRLPRRPPRAPPASTGANSPRRTPRSPTRSTRCSTSRACGGTGSVSTPSPRSSRPSAPCNSAQAPITRPTARVSRASRAPT